MNFDDAVAGIGTLTEVRRIAGAHVVDHNQLCEDELRDAVLRVKPQYLHEETVRSNLEQVLHEHSDKNYRDLSWLLLVDVLLDQYDFSMPASETDGRVIAIEQSIIDRSNEVEIVELACGNQDSQYFRDLGLYCFVLETAWAYRDSVSPDETNLLRRLRERLQINEWDHRTIEAKLSKYPKPDNELHTRGEIEKVRRYLQGVGLLFTIRDPEGVDYDVIPDELAILTRRIVGVEIRRASYRTMLRSKPLRSKKHLQEILSKNGVEFSRYDTIDALIEHVVMHMPASHAISCTSPRFGLSSDQLTNWCRELGVPLYGSVDERVQRVIAHFDAVRPQLETEADERARWYEFYQELARRDRDTLRTQHVVEKDIEIEAKFEGATQYLFYELLNHMPLQQPGSNHPDGLVSLGNRYLMWDNKSKESPVNLRDHIDQFHSYIEQADKPVPIFLVIGPDFTHESEIEAIRYHSKYFDRNIKLITAEELKALAGEWSSHENKFREEPFPLGYLATTGRFNRKVLGKLF
jgi:hypothetical protein